MVDIPYELWLQIASFLTKDEIWALRSLNKCLRDIAMDSRFQRVAISIQDTTSKAYRRGLQRFSLGGDIAERVRELAYFMYATTDFPPLNTTPRRTRPLLSIKRYFRRCIKSDKALVVNAIENFTKVRSVKINFDFLRGTILQKNIPIFHASLLSSSGHLQSLHFSYPFEAIGSVLPPALFLPRLSSFSMTLFTLPEKTEVDKLFLDTATTTMVPFLNRHRLTLTALELKLEPEPPAWAMLSPLMSTNFNLSPLYGSLDHIPLLQALTVSTSAPTPPECITRLLKIHFHTLRQLTIHMTDPQINSTRGILDKFEVQFPQLETFVIQYHYDMRSLAATAYQEEILGFIRQHASSLATVKILNSFHDRARFLTLFNSSTSYPKLRYLKMALQILTPEMMDVFSSCLSDLYELDLLVRHFKRRHSSPLEINEEYEFCHEMGHHDYQHWKLKHLTLTLDNRGRRAKTSYGAAAVAEVMPFLHTFNGLPWENYTEVTKYHRRATRSNGICPSLHEPLNYQAMAALNQGE